MKEFNDTYNLSIRRLIFWHELSAHLVHTERLIQSGEQLSRADKKALKQIRKAITESYKLSERQREYHRRQLRQQRKEYLNGSEVTDASEQH